MLDPDISAAAARRHLTVPEIDPGALDRRRFLQLVGAGLGAGLVAGPGTTLLDSLVPGGDRAAWAAGPIGPDDGILVVIKLDGGNDGLNTVVPFNDGQYYQQHGPLAIAGQNTHAISSDLGLNGELSEMKRFWDAGQLAVVQGIGYPNPDFSHFSSMAKWMSGQPSGVASTGWLGRWLDQYLSGSKDLYAAAEVGQALPLLLAGAQALGTTVPVGPPEFGVPETWRLPADQSMYDMIRSHNTALQNASPGGYAAEISQSQVDQLAVASSLGPLIPSGLSPDSLASRLEVAARLINANLGFRVLSVGLPDFDSHADQPDMHPARMRELNAGLRRFFEVLQATWGGRVTVMTFSEFGRTSHQNDGLGTDHGTAAPHFVMGATVRGGLYGQRPSLSGLGRWDRMAHHVDYRDYFGTIIDGVLGGGSSDVLDRTTDDLGFFASGPGPDPQVPGAVYGSYVPMSPVRVLDTRSGTGGRSVSVGPGETIDVDLAGQFGLPANGVLAVALNITAVRSTVRTFLTAYPTGGAKPEVSTVNARPGEFVPNMTVVGLGAGGKVSIYNDVGNVNVLVDLAGYYTSASASRLTPLTPARLLDTRLGVGAPKARVRGRQTVSLQVAGRGGVPNGATAAVINLAAVGATRGGFVTAFPSDETMPIVSNLNYAPGTVVPNLAMVKLGSDGKAKIFVSDGELHLVGDVVAYFAESGGVRHVPVTPTRILDTRLGNGAPKRPLGEGGTINLTVGGRAGIPHGAKAVVMNVAAIGPTKKTFVTTHPTGETRPNAASLNVEAGSIAANLTVAKIGTGGRVAIYNEFGSVHLIGDVTGYYV